MSKTFKKRKRNFEYEEQEDDYGYVKHNFDKTKKKRFDRALKTLNIDELLEYEEEFDDSTEFGP